MLSYEKKTRGGTPINPAKILYRAWLAVLEPAWPHDNWHDLGFGLHYGPHRGYGIGCQREVDDKGRPIITFGCAWGTSGIGFDFKVNAQGEFQIGHKHGWKQRDTLASMTFLSWERVFGDFVWFYNPWRQDGHYESGFLADPNDQHHYVSEKVIRVRGWNPRPWLKLVPDDSDGWRIAFSRDVNRTPGQSWNTPVLQEHFDEYEALRQRRYNNLMRKWQIAEGWIPSTARKPIDRAAQEARKERAVQTFMDHMVLSTPTKTVPLRRTSEEEDDGRNTVDPADADGAEKLAAGQR